MISVSQDFKNAWADAQVRVADFKITYKRRYWNGSAYVLEAVAKTLDKSEIIKVSAIQWKLDTQTQNKILASNITLRLKNDRFKWLENNETDGLFKIDEIATIGYDPFRTEFQVFYGYELDDGTFEYVPLFTGEAIDYLFDSDSMVVEVNVRGRESRLQLADAQRVSTTFTNEPAVPSIGNGTNKDFLAKTSVWEVTKVRVAGAFVDQGSRWKLSDTNDFETAAKITIDPAPANLETVDWTGRRWLIGKRVSELVGLLCDEAGVLAGERDIEEPQYPGAAAFQQILSQADFDLGVKTRVETESRNGWLTLGNAIKGRDFLSQAELDDNWDKNPGVGGSISVIASIYDSNNMARLGVSTSGTHYGFARLIPVGAGASIEIPITSSARYIIDAGVDGPYYLRLGIKVNGIDRTFITTKLANSVIQSGTRVSFDASWSTGIGIPENPPSSTMRVDNIRAIEGSTGVYISKVFDLFSAPTAWGKITDIRELNGGTVAYETSVSSDDISYDPYVAVDVDGTILSALKRYIKVRVTITPTVAKDDGPEIDDVTINFFSTDLTVGHADFKGKTCFQAIQRLAEISDMEFGFNGAGRFFFRNKSAAPTPLLNLDQSNAIIKISSVKAGYDRVLNVAQISYNEYYSEVDSTTESEPFPTSIQRFGKKIVTQNINDFLFSNNANYAGAIAKLLRDNNYKPRRTMKLETRIIPHLELSDTISVGFFDSELIKNTVFGDELQEEPAFGGNQNVLIRDMLGKVVGISSDIGAGKATIEVQEVLI